VTDFRPAGLVCEITIAANNLLPAGRLPTAPGLPRQVALH